MDLGTSDLGKLEVSRIAKLINIRVQLPPRNENGIKARAKLCL